MLTLYRGHWIIRHCDERWVCEITEKASSEILPTTVTASIQEGPIVCLARAKNLVDRYCEAFALTFRNPRQGGRSSPPT